MNVNSSSSHRPVTVLVTVACVVFGLPVATAADWPRFKAGHWTFEREMSGTGATPDRLSTTECTDPTEDQREQREMLTKAGCEFSRPSQSGKTYRYSATCKMGSITTRSDSVLEVESAEAYTITVDSTVNGNQTHEVLRARRVGDCKK